MLTHEMLFHGALLVGSVGTGGAGEGLLPRVDEEVSLEVVHSEEKLAAGRAVVALAAQRLEKRHVQASGRVAIRRTYIVEGQHHLKQSTWLASIGGEEEGCALAKRPRVFQ